MVSRGDASSRGLRAEHADGLCWVLRAESPEASGLGEVWGFTAKEEAGSLRQAPESAGSGDHISLTTITLLPGSHFRGGVHSLACGEFWL